MVGLVSVEKQGRSVSAKRRAKQSVTVGQRSVAKSCSSIRVDFSRSDGFKLLNQYAKRIEEYDTIHALFVSFSLLRLTKSSLMSY